MFRNASWRQVGGFTAIELLFVMAIAITVVSIAVPLTGDALDHVRTGMAARYLEARIMDARMQAIRRSTRVALRFDAVGGDYRFAEYLDGNGNGVRASDIAAGADPELARVAVAAGSLQWCVVRPASECS